MDARLAAWARAVKARRRRGHAAFPVLWLFTDERRLADPRRSVASLPCGLAGVVLRHDGDPGRAELGRALARICRARRLALVVAGDVRLAAALGAGVHLRGGRWPGQARTRRRLLTSSAHGPVELRRAWRAGANLAFLSPAFATPSHPQAGGLGPVRWSRIARGARLPVAALGGVSAASARRLPVGVCCGAGAIGALI
ncbi:MAG TPA: thiamine phosphate synthase [Acetobacteraceae bacterium]|nr:thiamine phosphate synthase [Acetobacteraceae bacterium]